MDALLPCWCWGVLAVSALDNAPVSPGVTATPLEPAAMEAHRRGHGVKIDLHFTSTTDLVSSVVNIITGHQSPLSDQTSDPVAKEKQQEPSGFLNLQVDPSRPRLCDLAHIA
ncbi:hypothetical protein B0T20DRAFT_389911 [Sordaria brevicollis]|uniref:Uncharacterized protein n=1 Tax=Sordaria brevicollis TaxID=83679 RepID=A0AAE0PLC3_SORBR|nr:hypothetical protein B0T20DRAFT_389911 [Sordaria brevicollis]